MEEKYSQQIPTQAPQTPPDIPAPPASPLPQNIYPSPHHFPKKAIIAITLLFILLLTTGITWAFKDQIFQNSQPDLLVTATPTPTMPTATDPTANWKTYRNEEYGFEFKYPANLGISEQEKSVTLYPIGKSGEQIAKRQISISVEDNPKLLSAQDYWKEQINLNGYPTNPVSDVKLGDLDAIQADLPGLDHTKLSFIIISHNNVVLYISLNEFTRPIMTYDKTIEESVFDQILSTFNFIPTPSQSDDLLNLKLYKDPNYGFSFQYPTTWNYRIGGEYKEYGFLTRSFSISGGEKFSMTVKVFEGMKNISAQNFVNSYFYSDNLDATGNPIKDGSIEYATYMKKKHNGIDVTYINRLHVLVGKLGPSAWITQPEYSIFITSTSLGSSDEDMQEVLEKVLSSIKV